MNAKRQDMTLSTALDTVEINTVQQKIKTNSRIIEKIVNKLVAEYCKGLDDYLLLIQQILNDRSHPPTDEELDDIILNIPVLLYFAGEAQESLGIQEDVAKAIKAEVYNEVFNSTAGTIADKTAAAELATQDKTVVHIAYQRAYKKVKLRIDAASEVLSSFKKVVSRRMSEYEMTKVTPERIGGK